MEHGAAGGCACPPGPDSLLARAVSQNHDCTLRQHSAADSLLKVPSQRTAVILADPAAAMLRAAVDTQIGPGPICVDRLMARPAGPAGMYLPNEHSSLEFTDS